jgi:transposase InsO family protein
MISADLCGPMRTLALGGFRFSLVLVDKYSQFMWIVQLKAKSDTAFHFEKWVVKVNSESPAGYKVKRLHSDNGGEFVAELFAETCTKYQIVQTLTVARTHKQNPYGERAIGTINSLALTSMTTSNAPRNQWQLAQQNACTIVNAFPKEGEEL